MSILKRSSIRNRLLNSLSEDDFHALEPHLRPIALDLGRPVFRANAPLDNLIFPESGFASLTTDIDGSRVEIGLIGREGVTGISLTYGVDRVPFDCFVQSPGHGHEIDRRDFEAVLDNRRTLERFLLRYGQAFNVQTASTAFVNAEHTIEIRLARWLLMCDDRIDGNELRVTHEFLSMMLGVRRPGVTTTLHLLEGKNLIRSARGLITIRDRKGLEKLAENAYGWPEAEYERLMADERSASNPRPDIDPPRTVSDGALTED